MTDLSTTIAAKSDQLNADDLLGGPRDIEITKVTGCPEPEQPVAIHFAGDDGKPWKPCKTMRRVLVAAWGGQGADYVGRRVRLYRDPAVMFGGIAVGGLRISHMSHLDGEMNVALMVKRGKKAPYKVKVLETPRGQSQQTQTQTCQPPNGMTIGERADAYASRIASAPTLVKLNAIKAAATQLNADLEREDPELKVRLDEAWEAKAAELRAAENDEAPL